MKMNRRDFTAACLSGAIGLNPAFVGNVVQGEGNQVKFPVIDSHTHFYDPTRKEGVPWPSKEDPVLYRPVLPAEFKQLTSPFGVRGTVIIEASPWVEDNQWLLDLAASDPFVTGIVGHLAPGQDDFARNLARFSKNSLFRGIRIGSETLQQGLGQREFLNDLKSMSDLGLEVDVNGGIETLPLVDRLATQLPDLRIAINHLANVRIDGKEPPQDWSSGMQNCARHRHVFLKVSALTEGARTPERKPPAETGFYQPILEKAWSIFGEDRLIYGSDWPVSDLAAPYELVFRIVSEFFQEKGDQATRKFFAKNAIAAYGLKPLKD